MRVSLCIKNIQFSRHTAVISSSFSYFHPCLPLTLTPCLSHFCTILSAFLAVILFRKISIRNFRQFILFPTNMPRYYFIVCKQDLQVKFMVFISLLLWSLLSLLWCLANFGDQDREFSIYYMTLKMPYTQFPVSQIDLHLAIVTAPHYNRHWPAARTRGKVQSLSIMISSAFCWWSNSPNTFWINPLWIIFLKFCLYSFNILKEYLPSEQVFNVTQLDWALIFLTILFCFVEYSSFRHLFYFFPYLQRWMKNVCFFLHFLPIL